MSGPAEPTGVRVSRVFKAFGAHRPVLDGVDLEVRAGEFLCLLGPSGCGKSTLLNMIAGFTTVDSGEIRVGGVPVAGPGHDRGVLFQTPSLFPWLTTLQNVLYGPRARGALTPAVRRRAAELLDSVGLADFGDAYPDELSGGMRHRAAFARVLINEPAVLLMDEPFGALDAMTRVAMQRFLLSRWQAHRTTIVFVTHDVEEAVLLGDRICVLSGRPAGVSALLDVDLARPRTYDDTETLAFVTVKRHVRGVLESAEALAT